MEEGEVRVVLEGGFGGVITREGVVRVALGRAQKVLVWTAQVLQ